MKLKYSCTQLLIILLSVSLSAQSNNIDTPFLEGDESDVLQAKSLKKSGLQVSFPKDYCIVKETSYDELSPDLFPDGHNYPILQNVPCEMQQVTYTDIIEKRPFTSTFRITRLWKVEDVCSEDMPPLEHKQHINTSVLVSTPSVNVVQVEKNLILHDHSEIKLFQNKPNPYAEQTIISFYLPYESEVYLKIRDVSGKDIKTVHGHYGKGLHEELVKPDDILNAGVYYYSLTVGSFHATRTLVLIKK